MKTFKFCGQINHLYANIGSREHLYDYPLQKGPIFLISEISERYISKRINQFCCGYVSHL